VAKAWSASAIDRGPTAVRRLESETEEASTIDHVDYVGVPVRDLQRADDFYGKTLGLARSPNSSARWVEFDVGNVTLALVSPEAMGPQFLDDFRPNKVPIALRVPDVAEARKTLEGRGVSFEGEIIDSGVCHILGFFDPDGNALILHHRYAPYVNGSMP
jgi:catechol 2,3-dioxygenase-like lactoylglutathione lyase family enzyme